MNDDLFLESLGFRFAGKVENEAEIFRGKIKVRIIRIGTEWFRYDATEEVPFVVAAEHTLAPVYRMLVVRKYGVYFLNTKATPAQMAEVMRKWRKIDDLGP